MMDAYLTKHRLPSFPLYEAHNPLIPQDILSFPPRNNTPLVFRSTNIKRPFQPPTAIVLLILSTLPPRTPLMSDKPTCNPVNREIPPSLMNTPDGICGTGVGVGDANLMVF